MFIWYIETSLEVDVPLQMVWDFYANPHNWPKWTDQFEACNYEGELKKGSIVKAKVKNKTVCLPILVTEIKLYKEYKLQTKVPLFSQECSFTFKEISPKKTYIIIKGSIKSLLVPFMKSFFQRRFEKSISKSINLLLKTFGKK